MGKNIWMSFCIPTYNRANFVERCIKKIIQLQLKNIEIIVINNNSTDNTEEKILNLSKTDDRIIYYRNSKNIGQCGNIIKCFKKAKGKFIYLISDEDEIEINFFSKKNNEKINKYDLIVGNIYDVINNKFYLKKNLGINNFEKLKNIAFRNYLSGIIFRKSCLNLELLSSFLNEIGSDYIYIFAILMCLKNKNFKNFDEIICYKCETDKIQYTDNELKGIKAKYFQPLERIKQIKFYCVCIEILNFNPKLKKILYKILASNFAKLRVYNIVFLSFKNEIQAFDLEIKKIKQIYKYYEIFYLKNIAIKTLKKLIKIILIKLGVGKKYEGTI